MRAISDDERREVAERLRNAAARGGDEPWMVEDLMLALGFRCYEDGEDQLFARLADLIDRPKAKRETRQYDEYGPIWDYEGSEVKEIPLVDFGDRQEEASRYAESACAGL